MASCKKIQINLKRKHMTQANTQAEVKVKDSKVAKVFAQDQDEEDDENEREVVVGAKVGQSKIALPLLEDGAALFRRLRSEGEVLAEAAKFWQSIKTFDRALEAIKDQKEENSVWIEGADIPKRGTSIGKYEVAEVLDMKAQALMQVHEWDESIRVLQESLRLRPLWWASRQTLCRALLGLGSVRQARTSLARSLHLSPWQEELWQEDLPWCQQLFKHLLAEEEAKREQFKTALSSASNSKQEKESTS